LKHILAAAVHSEAEAGDADEAEAEAVVVMKDMRRTRRRQPQNQDLQVADRLAIVAVHAAHVESDHAVVLTGMKVPPPLMALPTRTPPKIQRVPVQIQAGVELRNGAHAVAVALEDLRTEAVEEDEEDIIMVMEVQVVQVPMKIAVDLPLLLVVEAEVVLASVADVDVERDLLLNAVALRVLLMTPSERSSRHKLHTLKVFIPKIECLAWFSHFI